MRAEMRVAVASSDGIIVNQHFGRADTFYIYELSEGSHRLLEMRKGRPLWPGGEHDEGDLAEAVELLADCDKVFVLQIGRGAETALLEKEVEPVETRGFIDEVLEEYIQKNGRKGTVCQVES
ncbi:MAG: hypothetical protein IJ833_06060 [Lachnospiraceae bacterium]|nr:hypothetical protein [Lachnospiraceae bacterium]